MFCHPRLNAPTTQRVTTHLADHIPILSIQILNVTVRQWHNFNQKWRSDRPLFLKKVRSSHLILFHSTDDDRTISKLVLTVVVPRDR